MFIQLDDDGQEFVVAYTSCSNNKTKAKYSSYERECLAIVSDVIFMVTQSLWLLITSHSSF
jgi:hypothetical protein